MAASTELLQRPSSTSRSLGTLPKGTILTLSGERRGNYAAVDVELEDGEVSGWVLISAINEDEDDGDVPKEKVPVKKPLAPKGKGVLPKDESLLLRRDPTFYYGGSVGLGYHLIQSQFDKELYSGVGPHFDGYFGYFVAPDIAVKIMLGYSSPTGSSASTGQVASINLFDIGAYGEIFFMKAFRGFAGLTYSMGIGLGDLPRNWNLASSAEVSSAWGVIGGGYTFQLSDVIRLVANGFYGISFVSAPVAFQTIGMNFALEFQG